MRRRRIKYYYLSIKTKPLITTWTAFGFMLTTIFLFQHITWWLAPIITAGLFLTYLLSRIGIVSVIERGDDKLIEIRGFMYKYTINPPITYSAWWNYTFDQKSNDAGDSVLRRIRNASNDLNVNLHCEGSSVVTIGFTEKIYFDTRFPNEVLYESKAMDSHYVIGVQRVDKLLTYLQKHLSDDEMVRQTSQ